MRGGGREGECRMKQCTRVRARMHVKGDHPDFPKCGWSLRSIAKSNKFFLKPQYVYTLSRLVCKQVTTKLAYC